MRLQVSIELGRLSGGLAHTDATAGAANADATGPPVDVSLEATLALDGRIIDGPTRAGFAAADGQGAVWVNGDDSDTITFAVKVRKLLHAASQNSCACPLCASYDV